MTIISTSAFYERTNAGFTALRKHAEQLQAQVASGQRVSKSSDDPVAASRLRDLSRADDISAANVANANRAMSDLSLADAAIQEIADNLARAKELAVQAATGTLSNSQRASIGEQIANIRGNIIALANSKRQRRPSAVRRGNPGRRGLYARYQRRPGLCRHRQRGRALARRRADVVTAGSPARNSSISASAEIRPTCSRCSAPWPTRCKAAPDPAGAANASLDAMDAGLEKITATQTVLGGRMNWVDLNVSRHQRQGEMRELEQTDVGSIDTATTITDLQEIMTVLEASQASFVKLASLSLFDVIR